MWFKKIRAEMAAQPTIGGAYIYSPNIRTTGGTNWSERGVGPTRWNMNTMQFREALGPSEEDV